MEKRYIPPKGAIKMHLFWINCLILFWFLAIRAILARINFWNLYIHYSTFDEILQYRRNSDLTLGQKKHQIRQLAEHWVNFLGRLTTHNLLRSYVGQAGQIQLSLTKKHSTLKVKHFSLERVTGIEPVSPPWQGGIIPVYYTRIKLLYHFFH